MKLQHAASVLAWGLALCAWVPSHPGTGNAGQARSVGVAEARAGKADKVDRAAAADNKGAAWVDYEAPDGIYKARFPAAPKAETKKGVPTFVIARHETLGGLHSGPMYYVSAMVGKSQNTPPTDLLPGLLTTAEQQGFQALGVQASDAKPFKDGQGNPGRRVKLTHAPSHRVGIGKVVVNRLTGAFLIVAAFGPDAEAFLKSAQFL